MQQNFNDFKGLLQFQLKRHSVRHSKNLLVFMEDLQKEHQLSLSRAKLVIPEEYHDILDQLALLDGEKMQHIRKRILDISGEFQRDAESELDHYDVTIKFKGKGKQNGEK